MDINDAVVNAFAKTYGVEASESLKYAPEIRKAIILSKGDIDLVSDLIQSKMPSTFPRGMAEKTAQRIIIG